MFGRFADRVGRAILHPVMKWFVGAALAYAVYVALTVPSWVTAACAAWLLLSFVGLCKPKPRQPTVDQTRAEQMKLSFNARLAAERLGAPVEDDDEPELVPPYAGRPRWTLPEHE